METEKELEYNEQIANSVNLWIETLRDTDPLFEIHKALEEGTISYREYLHLVGSVTSHFVDTLGFVPNHSLLNIVHARINEEGTNGGMKSNVRSFISSLGKLQSYCFDDYL